MLTKSKYLNGLQCPRLIWIQIHEPEKIPQTDPVTQHIFDQGHLVGVLAKQLFPDGIDLSNENFMGNISKTRELLTKRVPLFEPGILVNNLYSRLDILVPAGKDDWDIYEVKASTAVKDVNINDVAFQRHCCIQAGLRINKCCLITINNKYVRNGDIDPKELFTVNDVTAEVEEASEGINDGIEAIQDVISRETCPEMLIGPHCSDPYQCALTECWDCLPEHNIFSLYYGGKKAFAMYDAGIINIAEIPDTYKLNDQQLIQKACVLTGKPHIDKHAIGSFLSSLEYPLYYFDFETIAPAVPLFDGIRPYQNVPFQYSLHVVGSEGAKPEHYSFLAGTAGDPRQALLSRLRREIGDKGTILAYNKGFEEGILKEMAVVFPEHSDWLEQTRSRMVDLLTPFKSFAYYHPAQKGSASLKAVMPAVTGSGYKDLDIDNGQIASILYLSAIYGEMPEAEKTKILTDLEKYCGRDTEGMIWIVEKLRDFSKR